MLSKIIQFVKKNQTDIILLIGVILISLLSFALGYVVAKKEDKTPIKFELNEPPHQTSLASKQVVNIVLD